MHQFQKLSVWQKAMEVTKLIYNATNDFPDTERYGLTSQMRRAAVSIPSNIAEGSGRNSPKEFRYHLSVSAGSASELITQTILCKSFGYISDELEKNINNSLTHILNMIFKLQQTL